MRQLLCPAPIWFGVSKTNKFETSSEVHIKLIDIHYAHGYSSLLLSYYHYGVVLTRHS